MKILIGEIDGDARQGKRQTALPRGRGCPMSFSVRGKHRRAIRQQPCRTKKIATNCHSKIIHASGRWVRRTESAISLSKIVA